MQILIVDDEMNYREVFTLILRGEGYITETAASAEEAIEKLERSHYDIVLTDLVMSGMDGIELLDIIKEKYEDIEVIIVTGYGSVQNAVEAMKNGAYSYFIKSHDPQELLLEIDNIKKMLLLERNNYLLQAENPSQSNLIGKNKAFKKILDIAERAAKSNVNILLLGESGVGKEVFAQYIHACSERSSRLFIPVNCHALPESMIESELFGHERGSFTGANQLRKGKFEAADGSTIFLDEIGDITKSFQVKLLRTLETKTIERIGSNNQMYVDFRLITATNCDIHKAVQDGDFREDLYYRISTITIEVPPLRERKDDIPEFISFFIREISEEQKKKITKIEDTVMDFLLDYQYPGNVRELRNIIERMVTLSEDGVITENLLPVRRDVSNQSTYDSLKEARSAAEKKYIEQALKENADNITRTAEKLQISRRQLFNKLQEYGISAKE